MIHVSLCEGRQRRLPFYLAMEEWVARNLPPDDYFFCWQVRPTVIFGRNQCIDTEVNLDYCRENSIEAYRRKSGGGCVFADMHNIMFSYITTSEDVTATFSSYTAMVASMLCSLGIDASASGRNDVTISGRKVSGNSFYHIPGRSIIHGTMLYDTDLRHMANAITPSRSKLESKQVKSVASHITTLREHLDMSIDDFRRYAINALTDSEIVLSLKQIDEIEVLSRPYYDPEWIYGRKHATSLTIKKRIEGVGDFAIGIDVKGGRIADINIDGDFFLVGDLDTGLLDRIKGCRYVAYEIERELEGVDVSRIIAGLSTADFIKMITN